MLAAELRKPCSRRRNSLARRSETGIPLVGREACRDLVPVREEFVTFCALIVKFLQSGTEDIYDPELPSAFLDFRHAFEEFAAKASRAIACECLRARRGSPLAATADDCRAAWTRLVSVIGRFCGARNAPHGGAIDARFETVASALVGLQKVNSAVARMKPRVVELCRGIFSAAPGATGDVQASISAWLSEFRTVVDAFPSSVAGTPETTRLVATIRCAMAEVTALVIAASEFGELRSSIFSSTLELHEGLVWLYDRAGMDLAVEAPIVNEAERITVGVYGSGSAIRLAAVLGWEPGRPAAVRSGPSPRRRNSAREGGLGIPIPARR